MIFDAAGKQIISERISATALSVPFSSARHALEVGTALSLLHKNLQDTEPAKKYLAEAMEDIAFALDKFTREGGNILGFKEEVVESTPSPTQLLGG